MTDSADATKVALVTGGSSGLGGGMAVHLATLGFDVLVHYHANREGAEKVAEEIRSRGQRAEVVHADLTSEAGSFVLRDAVAERFGRLDLLVNASAAYSETPFAESTEAEWFAQLNSSATAVYFTTRNLLPLLRESRGQVVNVGDTDATQPNARVRAAGYHVGKCGVWLLTCSFAAAESANGVAVNMISPGLMENSSGLGSPAVVPAGRFGTTADLTTALDMLLASDNAYVTGSNIVVSGGWNV